MNTIHRLDISPNPFPNLSKNDQFLGGVERQEVEGRGVFGGE